MVRSYIYIRFFLINVLVLLHRHFVKMHDENAGRNKNACNNVIKKGGLEKLCNILQSKMYHLLYLTLFNQT